MKEKIRNTILRKYGKAISQKQMDIVWEKTMDLAKESGFKNVSVEHFYWVATEREREVYKIAENENEKMSFIFSNEIKNPFKEETK